jgi:AraC-like DNA-binding protein
MTLKPLHPVQQETEGPLRWQVMSLPIGLRAAVLKDTVEEMDLALPDFNGKGFFLQFINYKGDLRILTGDEGAGASQSTSPGSGLLSVAGRPLRLRSAGPIQIAALVLFLPEQWVQLLLAQNVQFRKIGQVLEDASNIITCRLGRRQLSLLSATLGAAIEKGAGLSGALATSQGIEAGLSGISTTSQEKNSRLLGIQNTGLALVEYFLGNRHRSLLGMGPAAGIDNEDDLSLIREVESYISEYFCSDTFTVDSILKRTYTSYHRLNFLFKSIHGMTISEYIRNKRIEKSKEMIADNAKSISQIAYEIGYSSISNYILAFKKVYRITPGKYKKQIDNLA